MMFVKCTTGWVGNENRERSLPEAAHWMVCRHE